MPRIKFKIRKKPNTKIREVKINWLCVPKFASKKAAAKGPATLPKDSKENASPIVVPCPSFVSLDKIELIVGRKRLPPMVEIEAKKIISLAD